MAQMFQFGSGLLTALRNDISGTQTPRRFGVLQDVSVEFNGDVKELFGQYQFPVDTARGKTKISGKAKLANIDVAMYNDIFFGQTKATGALKFAFNEAGTIPGTPYAITVTNAASTPLADQGVFFTATGAQLDAVAAAPATGQYTFDPATGKYTFAAADTTKAVLLNYTYTVSTGHNIAISGQVFMGNTPRFQMTLLHQFEGEQMLMQLYSCTSQRLTYPTRLDDYVVTELDFSAFANGAGAIGSINTTT